MLSDVAAATINEQFVTPDLGRRGARANRSGPGVVAHSGRSTFSNPVTGAVEAVATHPDEAGTIIVGTVGGGIWKTTDAGSGSPTWFAKTDQFASLSISGDLLRPDQPGHRATREPVT